LTGDAHAGPRSADLVLDPPTASLDELTERIDWPDA
jgi:hypothetical protein